MISPLKRFYENEFPKRRCLFFVTAQKKAGTGKLVSLDKVLE